MIIIISIASFLIFERLNPVLLDSTSRSVRTFNFGVAFGGNTTAEAKILIDKVKNFTNLFVIQSGPVSTNETAMNQICDYAVNAGLNIIVYIGWFNPKYPWQTPWLDNAKQRWGGHFLGMYLNDELGGKTIDANWKGYFNEIKLRNSSSYYSHAPSPTVVDQSINGTFPMDNSNAAYHYVQSLKTQMGLDRLHSRQITSYSSDYALYWFDYLGGYDTIFTQLGFNHSIAQSIALMRGAANMQNKDWGVILTWTYDKPPYLVNGTEIYRELVTAYSSSAKYGIIFNYPALENNSYGILTEDHFAAMKKFWDILPSLKITNTAKAAFVLPYAYGWGMRNQNDTIWGLWKPDNKSALIWTGMERALSEYGLKLDIIYDDPEFKIDNKYQNVIWWNATN